MTAYGDYNTKVGFAQGGDILFVKDGAVIDIEAGGGITGLPDITIAGGFQADDTVTETINISDSLSIDSVSQALTYTISHAAGATNSIDVTVTAKDAAGVTVAAPHIVEFWISEAATGIGLTADSASGNLTASGGAIHTALTAKKHVIAVTAATGIAVFNLVDAAKPADQYFCAKTPFGRVIVSAASGTNWGA